jgi:uncharacterized protein (DUF2236 family)
MAEHLEGGVLAVGAQAREVARQLLYPPATDPTRPAAWLTRLVTVGLLPEKIRDAYGFPWSPRRERSLRIVARTIRTLLPALPGIVRYWSASRDSRA